jgi:hypothetical protein
VQEAVEAKLARRFGSGRKEKGASSPHGLVPCLKSLGMAASLCLIATKATTDEAIQSRAVVLYFDPTNVEIRRAIGQWFWSQVV